MNLKRSTICSLVLVPVLFLLCPALPGEAQEGITVEDPVFSQRLDPGEEETAGGTILVSTGDSGISESWEIEFVRVTDEAGKPDGFRLRIAENSVATDVSGNATGGFEEGLLIWDDGPRNQGTRIWEGIDDHEEEGTIGIDWILDVKNEATYGNRNLKATFEIGTNEL